MDTTVYEKLLNAGFRYVSFRPRSRKEIRDFLEKKCTSMHAVGVVSVDRVMERLTEYGYLDDRKFAVWWISQRSLHRPKGPRALMSELSQKGISSDIIAESLTSIDSSGDSYDEESSARKSLLKKNVRWGLLPIIEQKKKVYTFLSHRGFSSGIIHKIIDGLGKNSYNE